MTHTSRTASSVRSSRLFQAVACAVLLGVAACKEATPPEPLGAGPLNPSFELAGSGNTASGWTGVGTDLRFGNPCTLRSTTLAGFMPTDKVSFMVLSGTYAAGFEGCRQSTIQQDEVDLKGRTQLSFDYTVSGTIGAGNGSATVRILFTSSGTQTLWERSYTEATGITTTQKLGETIDLPALTAPGRLTVETLRVSGISTSGVVRSTILSFTIDNFRVQ